MFSQAPLTTHCFHLRDAWDTPISHKADSKMVSPTMLDLVKNKIIGLSVQYYIISSDYLEQISVRRSRRNQSVIKNNTNEVTIEPIEKRVRITPNLEGVWRSPPRYLV